jgi:malate dehydrogenase (quinone)
MVALLGASPGASTAVAIMVNIIERMTSTKLLPSDWRVQLKKMIPSYGESLITDAALCKKIRANTAETLGLVNIV